eukprot:3933432-Rhodomonas_salina.2
MLDVGSDDSVLMFFQLAADVACCRLLTAGKKGPSRFLVRSPVFLVKPGTQVLYGAFRISRRTWYLGTAAPMDCQAREASLPLPGQTLDFTPATLTGPKHQILQPHYLLWPSHICTWFPLGCSLGLADSFLKLYRKIHSPDTAPAKRVALVPNYANPMPRPGVQSVDRVADIISRASWRVVRGAYASAKLMMTTTMCDCKDGAMRRSAPQVPGPLGAGLPERSSPRAPAPTRAPHLSRYWLSVRADCRVMVQESEAYTNEPLASVAGVRVAWSGSGVERTPRPVGHGPAAVGPTRSRKELTRP